MSPMIEIEITNALIESTYLGLEDHGIGTCYLYLTYDVGCQAFGGYALDEYDKIKKNRVGTAFGMEFLKRICATVGVSNWEKLPGKHIRVKAEHNKVHGIGHIIEDKWFYPASMQDEFYPDTDDSFPSKRVL